MNEQINVKTERYYRNDIKNHVCKLVYLKGVEENKLISSDLWKSVCYYINKEQEDGIDAEDYDSLVIKKAYSILLFSCIKSARNITNGNIEDPISIYQINDIYDFCIQNMRRFGLTSDMEQKLNQSMPNL